MYKRVLLTILLLNIIPAIYNNSYQGAKVVKAGDSFAVEGGDGEDPGGGDDCSSVPYTLTNTTYSNYYYDGTSVYATETDEYTNSCSGDSFTGDETVLMQDLTDEVNQDVDEFNQVVDNSFADNTQLGSDIGNVTPDGLTKYKNPHWRCFKGGGPTDWELDSYESGVVKSYTPSGGQPTWVWVSLTHNTILAAGTLPPAMTVTWNLGNATPSFTPATAAALNNITTGGMSLDFNVVFTPPTINTPVANIPLLTHITTVTGANQSWSANPNSIN